MLSFPSIVLTSVSGIKSIALWESQPNFSSTAKRALWDRLRNKSFIRKDNEIWAQDARSKSKIACILAVVLSAFYDMMMMMLKLNLSFLLLRNFLNLHTNSFIFHSRGQLRYIQIKSRIKSFFTFVVHVIFVRNIFLYIFFWRKNTAVLKCN